MSTAKLSREAIARAAVELVDDEGIDGLTMRRVAARLDVGTMSLYHYVADRDALLTLMADEIMGELLVDELPPGWRDGLRAIALRTRATFDRHPWMLKAMFEESGPLGLNGMRHFEQSLSTLADLELARKDRLHILSVVDEYAFGALLSKQSPDDEGRAIDAASEYIGRHLEPEQFPNAFGLMHEGEDPVGMTRAMFAEMLDDDRFELGLDLVLDGVEAFLRRRGAVARRGR